MTSALAIISVFLPLLRGVLAAAMQNNSLPQNVIDALSVAVNALSSVHGSAVSKEQLESLRLEPKW